MALFVVGPLMDNEFLFCKWDANGLFIYQTTDRSHDKSYELPSFFLIYLPYLEYAASLDDSVNMKWLWFR